MSDRMVVGKNGIKNIDYYKKIVYSVIAKLPLKKSVLSQRRSFMGVFCLSWRGRSVRPILKDGRAGAKQCDL